MLLTALFAFNIGASYSFEMIEHASIVAYIEHYLGVFLLIAVGLCIDISKYLFWFYRQQHGVFFFLSLILVCFSWAASVAFFTTKEKDNIRHYQVESSQYMANKKAIALLEATIEQKRALLKKRLSSSYHSQWDKGEKLVEKINALNDQLRERIERADHIGIEDAQSQLSTSALFMMLSSWLSLSFNSVSNIAYGVLSLIIEVCALGVMSLAQVVKSPAKSSLKILAREAYEDEVSQEKHDDRIKKFKKMQTIKDDILSEKIEPLISKIIKIYSISHKDAKAIMQSLEAEGKIMIKRSRYYLLK